MKKKLSDDFLIGRSRDICGMEVKRVLPYFTRQMIGPFIFFDQMGSNEFLTDGGLNLGPHPHIGLATLTYLFSGQVYHRDSIGSSLTIRLGDVNLMVSGKGITHSERRPVNIRFLYKLFGIQCWLALPKSLEVIKPEFYNCKKEEIPLIILKGMTANIILGSAFGEKSPLKNILNGIFIEIKLLANKKFEIPKEVEELSIYVLLGELNFNNKTVNAGEMLFLDSDRSKYLEAIENCHFILLGGDTINEKRYLWWNFVASDMELIEITKNNWLSKKSKMPVGNEKDFIPLPN